MNLINHLEFEAPIKIISEANNYDNWRKKLKRKQSHRQEIMVVMKNALKRNRIKLPCDVHFTRIGPKKLDDNDNLNISFKAIRDEIAKQLGVDDGDTSMVNFTYSQEPCKVRRYAVKVKITSRLPAALPL